MHFCYLGILKELSVEWFPKSTSKESSWKTKRTAKQNGIQWSYLDECRTRTHQRRKLQKRKREREIGLIIQK